MLLIKIIVFCFVTCSISAQDNIYLKVHFLYGSKPLWKHKDTQKKWFGGLLGGHVGIESDSGKIINFVRKEKFHLIAKKQDKHSRYAIHSFPDFYNIFRDNVDSVKKTIIYVPITKKQKEQFDSITQQYIKETPYDYAFIGMRCGAATYELLGQLNILPKYSYTKTYLKIFYPKLLRKRLLKKANEHNWTIIREEGSRKRRWERD